MIVSRMEEDDEVDVLVEVDALVLVDVLADDEQDNEEEEDDEEQDNEEEEDNEEEDDARLPDSSFPISIIIHSLSMFRPLLAYALAAPINLKLDRLADAMVEELCIALTSCPGIADGAFPMRLREKRPPSGFAFLKMKTQFCNEECKLYNCVLE